MKAVGFTRHGKPDVLSIEEIPDLTPGAGEQGRVMLQPQSDATTVTRRISIETA